MATKLAAKKKTKVLGVLNRDVDSKVLCVECEQPIPLARLKIVSTDTCVMCMEDLELKDKFQRHQPDFRPQGTIRHKIEFEVNGVEEVESINLHIRRGSP
jgi:hypothetical protein